MLLDARPVRRILDLADSLPAEDDESPFRAFMGVLLGLVISLPLWAAVAIAAILILR